MDDLHLIHSKFAEAEAAALVFCSAFLDFSPQSELLNQTLTPLFFEVEFSSLNPIDEEAFVHLEEKCRFLLKDNNVEIFEMVPEVARQFLSHHKQKAISKILDLEASTVSLAKLGSFVGPFEGTKDTIKEIENIKIYNFALQKEALSPKKALYHITFRVVFSNKEASIKEKIKAVKEGEKRDFLIRGQLLEIIHYTKESERLVILPKGTKCLHRIYAAFTKILGERKFREVITSSETLEEFYLNHEELHKNFDFKKTFEEKFTSIDSPLKAQSLALLSFSDKEVASGIIYSLNFLEEMIKILGLSSKWVLSKRSSRNKGLYNLLEGCFGHRNFEKEVTIKIPNNRMVASLVCEDCFQRLFPLMWLEIRATSEGKFLIGCSLGSIDSLLRGVIEQDKAVAYWLSDLDFAETCK